MILKFQEEFLKESNKIEGIIRALKDTEIAAFQEFTRLDRIEVDDVCKLVKAFQPNAQLRDKKGLDVIVGNHMPPPGGKNIRSELVGLLKLINDGKIDAYEAHIRYESLHPFTDGNGRSGRMIWWWMMGGSSLGFLHKWYYQSLGRGNI